VRVRARRLHDGRGVGRRSQQEGKSHNRSSNEGRLCPLPPLLRKDGAEDLSGPPVIGGGPAAEFDGVDPR
jgi:hypothetical protein